MGLSQWIDRWSRWQYSDVYEAANGNLYLEERETLEPPPEGSFVEHIVRGDDNLFTLAGYYYFGLLPRAAGLWWAIMEANLIIDPTQPLRPGTTLIIPDFQYIMWWVGFRHTVFV